MMAHSHTVCLFNGLQAHSGLKKVHMSGNPETGPYPKHDVVHQPLKSAA